VGVRGRLYGLGKVLEALGLILVLVGVVLSMRLGFEDESLASMQHEMTGLLVGGGLFFLGWLLERAARAR
jgi:hypothetical protein